MDVHPRKNGINRYWSIAIWGKWWQNPLWVGRFGMSWGRATGKSGHIWPGLQCNATALPLPKSFLRADMTWIEIKSTLLIAKRSKKDRISNSFWHCEPCLEDADRYSVDFFGDSCTIILRLQIQTLLFCNCKFQHYSATLNLQQKGQARIEPSTIPQFDMSVGDHLRHIRNTIESINIHRIP